MPDTIRQRIVDAIQTAARGISVSNGYKTNFGERAHVWKVSALTYAATLAVNMQDTGFQTVTLTGNVTISTQNRALSGGPVRSVAVKILCDGTDRTLAFAAGIKFVGSKPNQIVANKTGVLSLTSFGPNEADTLAAWAVES